MTFSSRLRELLKRQRNPVKQCTIDDPGLTVVVTAFDPAEADSAALHRAEAWDPDAPAVLRHHLSIPRTEIDSTRQLLASDGWQLRPSKETGLARDVELDDQPGTLIDVHALRVQQLDALHCAQERARMTSLAQRLGGQWLGWDALQPRTVG